MSGKKFTAAAAKVDQAKIYDVPGAVALVKSAAFAKFNETVEVALRLGVRPRSTRTRWSAARSPVCQTTHGTRFRR